jgi:hypothetical protein
MDAYAPPAQTSSFSFGKSIAVVAGIILLGLVGFAYYNYVRRSNGQNEVTLFGTQTTSTDKLPAPKDGKERSVIAAAEVPTSANDYGIQFWMYISDWDYRYGSPKSILKRVAANNAAISNPDITLHPTDNSLEVKVHIFSTDNAAADATGSFYPCIVENVPLQTWFSVSVTVFQRNLDIYINGRLVKSCVLPGVPRPVSGDIVLSDNGGFSGSICNVFTYGSMLTPDDASAFFAAGTKCQAPTPTVEGKAAVDQDSTFIKIFGYTFRFAKLSRDGKELSSYTF